MGIKELTKDNWKDLDFSNQGIAYVGVPMPDVIFAPIGVFGIFVNQSMDEVVKQIESLQPTSHMMTCYTMGMEGDPNHLWELEAYEKYESKSDYINQGFIILYYKPVHEDAILEWLESNNQELVAASEGIRQKLVAV